MPDETTVTGQEGTTPSPDQTGATTPPPTTPPEPTAPPSLSRDDVAAILREQLDSYLPDFASQLRNQLGEQFANKSEIQRTAQSTADKAFARAMKQLAPQMKGLDRLVQKGRMTQEDAEAAKLALLSDSAGSFAEEEEEAKPAPAPQTQQAPTQPPMPPYNPRQATQEAAEQLMKDSGVTWEDVTAEMLKFRSSMKRDMNLGEFTKLVAKRVADKEKTNLVAQAKREYEQATKAVRDADKNGATQTPPQGGAAGHTPKATLDDADDIGDVLRNKFFPGA